MSAPVAGTSTSMFPTDWAPSTRVRTPRSRARAQISCSGNTPPFVQSTCERAIEARLRRQQGVDLLRRHRGLDQVDLHPVTPLQVVEWRQAAGVFRGDRDRFVVLSPVYRGDAQVHAVGGVLGEGHVVGAGPDEPRGGLACPRGVLGLSGRTGRRLPGRRGRSRGRRLSAWPRSRSRGEVRCCRCSGRRSRWWRARGTCCAGGWWL